MKNVRKHRQTGNITVAVTELFFSILFVDFCAYRTIRRQTNSGQSSRGLDNARTSQLADNEFLKIMELLYFICTLNITLTITVTLSNIDSV